VLASHHRLEDVSVVAREGVESANSTAGSGFLPGGDFVQLHDCRRRIIDFPSNLAEGCGRHGDAELARFCNIASGSASELEYQILLARDLKLIRPDDCETLAQQIIEIKRMLTVFVQKLTAER